jgi:hypothetical protein
VKHRAALFITAALFMFTVSGFALLAIVNPLFLVGAYIALALAIACYIAAVLG